MHVRCYDMHGIVYRSGHSHTFDHLWPELHKGFKSLKIFLARQSQFDAGNHLEVQPQRMIVNQRHPPLDEAGLFHTLDAPPAG